MAKRRKEEVGNFFSWDSMMAKKWKKKVVSFLFLGFGDGQRKRKKGYKKKLWDSTMAKRKQKEVAFFFS